MKSALWRQIFIAFLIGVVAGLLVASKCPVGRHGFPPRGGGPQMFERFSRELMLTPDQKKKMAAILEDQREKFKFIHEEMRPRLEQMKKEAKLEIEAILTPEQREKFHKIEARR